MQSCWIPLASGVQDLDSTYVRVFPTRHVYTLPAQTLELVLNGFQRYTSCRREIDRTLAQGLSALGSTSDTWSRVYPEARAG